jgi:hypothetical protein
MMRFLADENVSRFVIERLRAAGFDVTSIGATSSGVSDKDVLATALSEDASSSRKTATLANWWFANS